MTKRRINVEFPRDDPTLQWEVRLCDLLALSSSSLARMLATSTKNKEAYTAAKNNVSDSLKALKNHLNTKVLL